MDRLLQVKSAFKPAAESDEKPSVVPSVSSAKATDRSLAHSVLWNASSDWGSQILTWLAFLVVMRLLTPEDFGVAALGVILMPYLGQITGFGIPRAVVAIRELTGDQLAQLTTVNVMLGALCFLFGLLMAKPFATFFRIPALAPVLIVTCSGLMLGAISGVPTAVLAKEMRFRFLSVLGAATAVIAAAATLLMAFLGFGYWALLLGNMAGALVRTAVILGVNGRRLAWPRFAMIREPLKFGWHISVSMLALNSYQRLDNFVAGRMLGQAALGLYGNAWELANVPIEKVTSLVTTVIPSYLSAVQDQPAEVRRYLRGLTEMIALATFPATVGLGLVAHELVPVVFGEQWNGMIGTLEVLSYYAAFRSIVALLPKVLTAVGKVRYVMWNDLAAAVILPVAFYVGSARGITGIAWGWVVAYPFVVLPLYHKTFRTIGMKIGEYIRALRPALDGTMAMALCVELVKHTLAPSLPLVVRLTLEIMTGIAVYAGTLWVLHRERVQVLVQAARSSVFGSSPVAQPS